LDARDLKSACKVPKQPLNAPTGDFINRSGRVVAVKAETDGDLHIELQDATGDTPGIVIVEVPAKPQWCEIRNTVFAWARTLELTSSTDAQILGS
jgi:hypothetical protein